jgi:DTW domain-containing protein YfiP
MRIHSVHQLIQSRIETSTRPFAARGSKVTRCIRCRVATDYCVCGAAPQPFDTLSCLLIFSPNEVLKPSNSGRLIADLFIDTFAFQWNRTEPEKALLSLFDSEIYSPVLVFPSEYFTDTKRLVTKQYIDSLPRKKRPLFIFIDGSWKEARKIVKKSEYLQDLPVMSITPQRLSEYVMRKSENQNHLATAEVASVLFEQLGYGEESDGLEQWFEVFKESYLLSKTRLKRDFSRPKMQQYLQDKSTIESN